MIVFKERGTDDRCHDVPTYRAMVGVMSDRVRLDHGPDIACDERYHFVVYNGMTVKHATQVLASFTHAQLVHPPTPHPPRQEDPPLLVDPRILTVRRVLR